MAKGRKTPPKSNQDKKEEVKKADPKEVKKSVEEQLLQQVEDQYGDHIHSIDELAIGMKVWVIFAERKMKAIQEKGDFFPGFRKLKNAAARAKQIAGHLGTVEEKTAEQLAPPKDLFNPNSHRGKKVERKSLEKNTDVKKNLFNREVNTGDEKTQENIKNSNVKKGLFTKPQKEQKAASKRKIIPPLTAKKVLADNVEDVVSYIKEEFKNAKPDRLAKEYDRGLKFISEEIEVLTQKLGETPETETEERQRLSEMIQKREAQVASIEKEIADSSSTSEDSEK